ncbi:phosphatidylserine decarboxylase [Rhodospirillum sp. A1_3_36]|uniref:phosphatidylserine decarboxylase n=1 Tax=Rhodospirillum sp. A1_3_36 TaxID=3391666 RepID=UPI0039A4A994
MKLREVLAAGVVALVAGSGVAWADPSPCQGSLDYLDAQYAEHKVLRDAFQAAYDGLQPLPPGYSYGGSTENPWKTSATNGAELKDAVKAFYGEVCVLLPQIVGTNDNALDSIQYFAWLYNHNEAGVQLVKGEGPEEGLDGVKKFLITFNEEYKAYMDSASSTGEVAEWIADPRLEIDDFVLTDPSSYKSWNQFFARNLKMDPKTGTYPSRPVTMPGLDYVIVSPTDCIMNPLVQPVKLSTGMVVRTLIENPLQRDTVLDVKGIPMSVESLLANAPEELKDHFVGASGLACVLMPNTYHHFHSPVDGTILYNEIVEAGDPYAHGTFGYSDWPNWVPADGNVGRAGTDFSQFEGFTRGVIIVEVTYANLPKGQRPPGSPDTLKGYVASIPVGLDTVGSVVFNKRNVVNGAKVKKGVTEFGNFYFGGSLNIMLFSPIEGQNGATMVSPAVQTRMGNQIGILNTPYAPPKTPWTPD